MLVLARPYRSDAATDVAASWARLKLDMLDVPLQTGHSEFVLAAYTLMSVVWRSQGSVDTLVGALVSGFELLRADAAQMAVSS
jgi:hypothetical protein